MDMKYLEFAYADPYFYDQVRQTGVPAMGRIRKYRLDPSHDWSGWKQEHSGGWLHVGLPEATLPDQGWKIHASATLDNAQRILSAVSAYCAERQIVFKFLPTSADLLRANVKYANRGGSGKFITIYPTDEAACERILADLDLRIGGLEGPYILSDLRWNDGPLYLRYGGFKLELVRNSLDELVPAIRTPDGALVPDERNPSFTPPAWVELPDFVRRQQERLGSHNRPVDFRYSITEALHFSNGGGIYAATADDDGAKVVIKEARPHAGLGTDGRSAVQRLEREQELLTRFAHVPGVVGVRDSFELAGHHFLVEDYVEGTTLNKELVMRNPLIIAGQTRDDRLAYRDWVLGVVAQIADTLTVFHDDGIVYGDLHPNNVMVRPDSTICFIDFEMAYGCDDEDVVPAGAPGFMPGDGRTGIPADLYSLGCIKLAMFLPLTVLLPLDAQKLGYLVREAQRTFELSDDYCQSILDNIGPADGATLESIHTRATRELVDAWDLSSPSSIDALCGVISRGARECADLSRADRIFPGDIRQFTENAFGVAHGACGHLLVDPGDPVETALVLDWVEEAVATAKMPAFGAFDGLAGVTRTMRSLGRHARADELVETLLRLPFAQLTSDLYGGLAGIGCVLLDEHARHPRDEVREAIERIGAELVVRADTDSYARTREANGVIQVATGKAGLLWGASGQATFWVRAHEVLGLPQALDHAQRALDFDLSVCVDCPDGSLQVNEGWRTLPYVASGSTGIGLALLRLLPYVDRPDYETALAKIQRAVSPDFTVQSNLFNGRAGFVYFLTQMLDSPYADDETSTLLDKHAQHLGSYAVVHKTGLHFPGEQIIRLSTDWGSGSLGVLTALRRYASATYGAPAPVVPFVGIERPAWSDDLVPA